MQEHNTAVVRRVVEHIWNRGDLALADLLFAAGYVNHGGLIPDLVSGPEAIKLSVALFRTAFPAFHISIEDITAEGDTVKLHWAADNTPATRLQPRRWANYVSGA
jgi:predicted SnoaL-like aldol condensation-catalyzing enzyme